MSDASVSIRAAVLCDDIRFEYNGKMMTVGVQAAHADIRKFPIKMKRHLLLLCHFAGSGETQLEFRMRNQTGEILLHAAGDVAVDFEEEQGMMVDPLPFGPFGIELSGPDVLWLDVRDIDGEWVPIQSWIFLQGNPADAPEPPSPVMYAVPGDAK